MNSKAKPRQTVLDFFDKDLFHTKRNSDNRRLSQNSGGMHRSDEAQVVLLVEEREIQNSVPGGWIIPAQPNPERAHEPIDGS